jgi:hypothetical protein
MIALKTFMENLMKKILSLFVLGMCSCFADDACSPNDTCPPCPDFIPTPAPRTCAYNAPDGVDLLCQWDLFLTGSFIWLEAKQDNMSLGTTIVRQDTSPTSPPGDKVDRSVNQFDFTYKPGFKVGLGMHFDCDNWDLYGEYTYFRSKVNSTISEVPFRIPETSTEGRIIPNWYSFTTAATLTEAKGKWDLQMDIGDLELGRQYYVGRCLTFRTFAGFRGLWIRQEVDVTYGFFNDTASPATTNTYTKVAKLKSWAVGPRFGVDTNWNLCGGFRFFANPAASLLYTKFTNTRQNGTLVTTVSNTRSSFEDRMDYNGDPCFVLPQAEMTVGLGWGDYFCCNRWYFDLEIGYTFNIFWDQNIFLETDMPFYIDEPDSSTPSKVKGGNLTLHGLVVTLRMEF